MSNNREIDIDSFLTWADDIEKMIPHLTDEQREVALQQMSYNVSMAQVGASLLQASKSEAIARQLLLANQIEFLKFFAAELPRDFSYTKLESIAAELFPEGASGE